MSLHATTRWLGMEENALRETIRKTAIVSILIGLLIPPFLLNLGVAVKGRLSVLTPGVLTLPRASPLPAVDLVWIRGPLQLYHAI